MNDNRKTKEQLIQELKDLRRRIAEFEKAETERKQAEDSLRESEEKYRSLASTEDSMYFVDRECRYRFMNKAHLLRLDLSLEKVIGRSYGEFHSEEDTKQFADRVEAVFATGHSFQTEHRSERDNKYFLQTFGPVKDLQGNITDITVISKDITERKRAEDALIQSEERYRTILDNTQEGYFEVDLAGNFTFVNDAECNDLGYTREELIGMNYKRYTDETAAKQMYELFNRVFRTGEQIRAFDGKFIKKDGTKGFNQVSVYLIKNKEGKPVGFRGLSRDITERKEAEEALKTLSLKDDLTGLFNRRGFFTVAEQSLKTAKRMGTEMMLFFGDLDNLKGINDTFGHNEGDQALVDTSQILKETFRESDIIARIGGDEFVILAMNSFETLAEKLINRFEQVLKNHPLQTKRPYTLSLSFGLACFDPQNPCSIDVLLAQADKIMYENKQKKGRSVQNF
jgi:diguanylate cyclase (GGDEF)-like protein/PAS domain S-box-containing protein